MYVAHLHPPLGCIRTERMLRRAAMMLARRTAGRTIAMSGIIVSIIYAGVDPENLEVKPAIISQTYKSLESAAG